MKTVKHLGRGAFGQVRLCLDDQDQYVAVKLVDLSGLNKVHRKRAQKEAKLLQKLSHRNILECRDVVASEKGTVLRVLVLLYHNSTAYITINVVPTTFLSSLCMFFLVERNRVL